MSLTLNELLCFDYFKGLHLIAGENVLSGSVSYCGILEYELDPKLNKKYSSTNFKPRTLAISSLFFARYNPFQILEAVKYLVAQEASDLVIKNIFRLPIHESVLHYAGYKDFPILLMEDTSFGVSKVHFDLKDIDTAISFPYVSPTAGSGRKKEKIFRENC